MEINDPFSVPGILAPAVLLVDIERSTIFMEEVPGARTISEVLNSSPTSPFTGLAAAVGHLVAKLHANNIIHGDLTTSNLLLDDNNRVYVIDFGLATSSQSPEDRGVDLYVLERAVISAHPNIGEAFFEEVCDAYGKGYSAARAALDKLDEVRLRGRKRVMIG